MANIEKTSIDLDQKDEQKVKKILKKNKLVSNIQYLFLTKNQKQIFKSITAKQKTLLETKKAGFNKDNIFEVENFDF
ncbi:MAG: hypothetical protein K2M43_00460 [Mycoplasmoidaceae bacterium]|nr:hypothetical protein [Mycoplasmoidaceae bacterium]